MKDYRKRILEIFNVILNYHKINDENQFIIKNYTNVIHNIEKYDKPINSESDLSEINGIGKGFLEKMRIIIETDTLEFYEKILKDKDYTNLVELYQLSGVGPKKIKELKQKNIKSVNDLRKGVKNGDIKISKMTKLHLKYHKDLSKKIPRSEVEKTVNKIMKLCNIKTSNYVIVGSYILGKKESKDIDLIIIKNNIDTIIKKLEDNNLVKGILMKGEDKVNLLIKIGNNPVRHIDIRIVEKKYLPYYILYFGSGLNFSRKIRLQAKEKGYKLDQYGLYKNGKNINFYPKSEKEIFKYLDIPYVIHTQR